MKQENFDYLSKQMQYLGFGDKLQNDLQKAMENGRETFSLPVNLSYGSIGAKSDVSYTLNFKKGNEDMFFFNSYNVKHNGQESKFYVNNGEKNITSKEAFNLMEGRCIYRKLTNKEGGKYTAWVKITPETIGKENVQFNVFTDNYGYDIEKALAKVNDRQLYFSYNKEDVIKSLEKGNLVEVHNMDKSEKYFVAADPQYKSVTIFNEEGKKMMLENINKVQDVKQEKAGIPL